MSRDSPSVVIVISMWEEGDTVRARMVYEDRGVRSEKVVGSLRDLFGAIERLTEQALL